MTQQHGPEADEAIDEPTPIAAPIGTVNGTGPTPGFEFFTEKGATHRIHLRPLTGTDDWVDIKADMSQPDQKAIADALAVVRNDQPIQVKDGKTADQQMSFRIVQSSEHQYMVYMTRMIVRWSLKQPSNGQPAPVDPAWVMRLRNGVGDWILRAMDAYYTERKAKAQASEGNSTSGS